VIEDNLIKQLYCFRSEQFKGCDSDFKFENLNEVLEDLKDNNLKTRIANYVFNQEDILVKQYCIGTEYFYGVGLKDGIGMMLDAMKK
jgi:hypothetical protein